MNIIRWFTVINIIDFKIDQKSENIFDAEFQVFNARARSLLAIIIIISSRSTYSVVKLQQEQLALEECTILN